MISLLIILALIGLLTWGITVYIPMPDAFKRLIVIVAIVLAALYVLHRVGVFDFDDPPVPQIDLR